MHRKAKVSNVKAESIIFPLVTIAQTQQPWSSRSGSPVSGVGISHFTTLLSLTPGTKSPPSLVNLMPPSANPILRTARNSQPLEVLGTYDPMPKPDPYSTDKKLHKDINLDVSRANYWVGVGAQPTDTAWRILSMAGILPKKSFGPTPSKPKGVLETKDIRIR